MPSLVFIDSTVFTRLLLGRDGADFAVNLFSRIERGVDTGVTDTLALYEAYAKTIVAAGGELAATHNPWEAVRLLDSDIVARRMAVDKAVMVASYVEHLVSQGRLLVIPVTMDHLAEALRLSAIYGLRLNEAVHIAAARSARVQKLATFNERMRRVSGIEFIP
ncbi:MAG: type II toxin-antitoxin system VapC family toxin [Crenarchaeota archaeon]|nr:type II toxin-antitoxin system VapC family toxin [Thermoproteota archaeon]